MTNNAGINDHNGPNAEALAARYKTIDRRKVHPLLFSYLDTVTAPLSILDIGSGSGDDAYTLAQMGHKVTAVEPSDLHHIARRDHAHKNITHIQDTLPELATLPLRGAFNLVMLSATWQYIEPASRPESLIRLASLMAEKGRAYLLYPSPPSREHQYEISPAQFMTDIESANQRISAERKLRIIQGPAIDPDVQGRKSLDGRALNFYAYILQSGHTP